MRASQKAVAQPDGKIRSSQVVNPLSGTDQRRRDEMFAGHPLEGIRCKATLKACVGLEKTVKHLQDDPLVNGKLGDNVAQ